MRVFFVDSSSLIVFKLLKFDKIKMEFLSIPPEHWNLMSAYREFKEFVLNIPVTKDSAERNVKLIQDFVNSSNDEKIRQDLLLAVEIKRKHDNQKSSKKPKLD